MSPPTESGPKLSDENRNVNRRNFLKASVASAGTVALTSTASSSAVAASSQKDQVIDMSKDMAAVPATVHAIAAQQGGNGITVTTPAQNISILFRYIESLNQGDHEVLATFLNEDLAHNLSRNDIEADLSTPEAVVEAGQITDVVHINVWDVIASGDEVAARYSYTVSGSAVQNADPNATAQVSGLLIARMENGNVSEVWHESDHLGMMLQLGFSIEPAA